MEGQWLHEPHGINLCFSTSSTLPRMNPSIETGTRNVTHVPSKNRKSNRPKVIKEGKATQAHKSTTSEPPKEKDKPTGKRKYVRRKEQNTTPTEHHPPSKDAVAHTIVVPTLAKRCFNFDGRDHHKENVDLLSQTRVEETPTCYGDAQLLTSAVEGSNIQLVQPWCGIGSPIFASVDPMANMRQIWAESSRANRVTFDLNNSAVNHIPRSTNISTTTTFQMEVSLISTVPHDNCKTPQLILIITYVCLNHPHKNHLHQTICFVVI
uniref:Uncharacterized protein n=1 Tax=Oryza barthii TaxID=65489 RepID=A0A0D3F5C9_9ORYZ